MTTKPSLRCRVKGLAGVGSGMVGLSLVTAITATLVVPPRPVAADQVSNLKAQAAQIAQDLVLEQLQIGSYKQRYDVDIAKVQRDEAVIGSREHQMQADISRVRRDRKRLQSEAVSAYINVDPEVNGTEVLFENQEEALTRAEYEKVASGDIALTIAALHTDENRLRAERATLEQQEARDQATTNQEGTLANAARQTEVQPRPSSQRSRASSPWRWPSSRRHKPPLRQQQSGRHRLRLLPQCPLRTRHSRLPPHPRHHRETPQARRRATRRCLPSSNASCRPSQAATMTPSRRGAPIWAASNSARRRGTKRPSWPACRSSSMFPQTRRLRPNRTISPSRLQRRWHAALERLLPDELMEATTVRSCCSSSLRRRGAIPVRLPGAMVFRRAWPGPLHRAGAAPGVLRPRVPVQ